MMEPTHPLETKRSSTDEVAFVIYLTALSLSTQTADRLLPMLKTNPTKDEQKKFQFDLSILYLVIAGKAILMSHSVPSDLKNILFDKVHQRYFADLDEHSADSKNAVPSSVFIAEEEERELFLQHVQSMGPPHLRARLTQLPSTTLAEIARFMFDNRFIQYQNLWNDDWRRKEMPNFFPTLALRALKHFSGKEEFEHFTIAPSLFQDYFGFYSELTDRLSQYEFVS